MTRARTPVRATRRASIRHSSACPRAHKRPASQHAGLRRNPAVRRCRAGTGRQGRRGALLAPGALSRGRARGRSVTSLLSAWCSAACCLLCRSASFQFVGSITKPMGWFIRSITKPMGWFIRLITKPMGWFIRSISNPWVGLSDRYQTFGSEWIPAFF